MKFFILQFSENRYKQRAELVENSYNIVIKNLTSADTGEYDVTFTIFESTGRNTRESDKGTLHLTVNGLYQSS